MSGLITGFSFSVSAPSVTAAPAAAASAITASAACSDTSWLAAGSSPHCQRSRMESATFGFTLLLVDSTARRSVVVRNSRI